LLILQERTDGRLLEIEGHDRLAGRTHNPRLDEPNGRCRRQAAGYDDADGGDPHFFTFSFSFKGTIF